MNSTRVRGTFRLLPLLPELDADQNFHTAARIIAPIIAVRRIRGRGSPESIELEDMADTQSVHYVRR